MDESHTIGLAASATNWELSTEMASSSDQSFATFKGKRSHLGSLDACDRCRYKPWVDGYPDGYPDEGIMVVSYGPLSASCPICKLFFGNSVGCQRDDISRFLVKITWNASIQVSRLFRPTPERAIWSQILLHRSTVDMLSDVSYLIWVSNMDEEIASEYQYCDRPKVSFSQIRENLDICKKHHQSCSLGSYRSLVNLRVIDCWQRVLVDAPIDCRYVALSYVWGEPSSSEDFVLSQSLPSTIEDTILATIRLGYRYLWIDRYCIDQQNYEDRQRQISQMSSIYRGAELTVIAAAGSNPSYGLPGVKKHRSSRSLVSHAKVGRLCFSRVPTDSTLADEYMADIAESKWASRAWTYQEALFSRRRLIFTNRQVIFSCNAKTCLESGIALPNQDVRSLASLWGYREVSDGHDPVHRLISSMKHYCGRSLTKDSDALNAILSTLVVLSGREIYHIWGVPVRPHDDGFQARVSDAVCGSGSTHPQVIDIWLSWFHPKKSSCRRPGFPSWSPLGWTDAPVGWSEDSYFTEVVQLRTPAGLESLSDHLLYDNRDPNEMPQLLRLRMRTAQGLVVDPDPQHSEKQRCSFLLSLGQGYYFQGRPLWDSDSIMEYESLKIAIFEKSEGHFQLFLLKSVSGHYERIGYSSMLMGPLDEPISFQRFWIQQQGSSLFEYRRMVDGDIWKADEERLRACFGNLNRYGWWDDAFKEEYVTLG